MRLTDNCFERLVAIGLGSQDGIMSKAEARKVTSPLVLDVGTYFRGRVFSFVQDQDKRAQRADREQLILSLIPRDGVVTASTGNYVGRVAANGIVFDIRSRFGDTFMRRMINFANDIYIDDFQVPGKRQFEGADYGRWILYVLFVGALERAFLLGMPKTYRTRHYHDMAVRGRIDIARFIRHDVPFLGRISSVSREQSQSQPIVDVLSRAIQIISQQGGDVLLRPITHVRAHLKEHSSGRQVSSSTIAAARSDKGLVNPVFESYRRVLDLAGAIISGVTTDTDPVGGAESPSFLVNVAELFEIYVSKLLSRAFPDWSVTSPKILLHDERFFARNIIPDIVMRHPDGRVAVFDTKYKRMHFRGRTRVSAGDVDRNDFFQISSYLSYFGRRKGCTLVAGGLIYPLAGSPDERICQDAWMADESIRFIIDGIAVSETSNATLESIIESENTFVQRMASVLASRTSSSLFPTAK